MIHKAILLVVLSSVTDLLMAQGVDTTRYRTDVAAAVTVTTKGISTIPSFTLGRPAAIFDVSIARRGLSFEPQFRFGLDGKPWSFLFWGRYKLLDGERFHLSIGAHPALAFRSMPVSTNAKPSELIVARRYLAAEVNSSYALTRNVRVGTYYLYAQGLEQDAAKHTNFLAARANLTSGMLSEVVVRVSPQLYYLRVDEREGFYLNSGLTLAKRNFPFSISTMVNSTIRTTVAQGDDVLWNVSLTYAMD